MTYRSILVQVDPTPGAKACVAAAARVAVDQDASLTGILPKSDSMPDLMAAEGVAPPVIAADELMQRHLKNTGCRAASLKVDRNTCIPTGEIIRRHIDMIGADTVFLVLFGRPRLAEIVLGGGSRNLLDNPTTPLLVSH